MPRSEQVSITCDSCSAVFTVPIEDIPEDAPLSAVARSFLDQHKGCAITIQVHGDRSSG
jgi:hypothetical protein